ncbi:unnamed protein product, partial [Polarella glacialis]
PQSFVPFFRFSALSRPSMLHRVVLAAFAVAASAWPAGLQASLESIARQESLKYNCSFSIALRSGDGEVLAAGGVVDSTTNQQAQVSDKYPWGSVTKMFTAASIMKLAAAGNFSLDDKVAPLVDPLLAKMAASDPTQNFSSLSDLFGDAVADTSLRQLLGMTSGVPDFDTATPSRDGGESKDPLRTMLYDAPDLFDSPTELMKVSWVAGHWKDCKPFSSKFKAFCYSSTNFMLLGLVLAGQASSETWSSFDQSIHLPASLRKELIFANRGAPKDYGTAHGYDRTSYNRPRGDDNDHDNWGVDGVFAGWTASNIVATSSTVAHLAWEIFGPPQGIAPKEFVDQMIPSASEFYGLGAFNLGSFTGHKGGPLGVGYGHLGATYGYQSIAGYFPELNIAMAIATNIETDTQAQPADAFCLAYNAVAGAALGKNFSCSFDAAGYFGGSCKCQEQSISSPEALEAYASFLKLY